MSDFHEAGVPCLWMRGGSSKGAYFLASDLPADPQARDALLLRIMGSPDPRQIDGIGGGDPLTSKVAVLSKSSRADADVDYLFLQVFVDQPLVSDQQPCGNILAGVGPAAIELGLMAAQDGQTEVTIHMVNTGELAVARVQTPDKAVTYAGDATIDGVAGRHAPVDIVFKNLAGSMTKGVMLPTGRAVDVIDGIKATLIDNGMPCVVMSAQDLGLSGKETPAELEANSALCAKIEAIRLTAGQLMGLGDVTQASVPKMVLTSRSARGAFIDTRCFIPKRVHSSLGVLAGVSIASAALIAGTPAAENADHAVSDRLWIEHPSGTLELVVELKNNQILAAGSTRTARKLFQGNVFPSSACL